MNPAPPEPVPRERYRDTVIGRAYMKFRNFYLKFLLGLAGCFLFVVLFQSTQIIRYQEPEFLTFNELKTLSKNPHPDGFLEMKLKRFWKTPIIDNTAYYAGIKPHRPVDPKLGPYLRLVSWNIEKSLRMKDAIATFSNSNEFFSLINPAKAPLGSSKYKNIVRQRERLTNADVIVLQEMDIGVKRSGYMNAAGELAKALNMNYTYGAEQLEVDPVYLGLEKVSYEGGAVDQEQTEYYAADPARYKGAFGCAVLSRYPIKRVWVMQLKKQGYDWYAGEKPKIGFVEETRRVGSEVIFKNQLTREMKVGGRIFFRVDLLVPHLPGNTLTIINVHLEIKCLPEAREAQMSEILSYIKGIKHPVIVVGDFNAAPDDLSPTSAWRVAERTVKNPETWLAVGTSAILPHALVINTTRFVTKFTKNLNDPFASDIAVVSPNPVKPMFKMIEDYHFKDGGVFDFRGDTERSVNGKAKLLSNSNQRGTKGFKTTWRVRRPISVIGRYRLDWVFVKSYLEDPFDPSSTYRFAPHFGETLEEMNTSLAVPISDHHPNVVDLPFKEPKIRN